MGDRSTRLLRLVAWLSLAAAVMLPLVVWAGQTFTREADLRWAVVNRLFIPYSSPVGAELGPAPGFTMLVTNEGRAPSAVVRLSMDRAPELAEMWRWNPDRFDRLQAADFLEEGDQAILLLEPLEPGEEVRIDFFKLSDVELREVLHGDTRVLQTRIDLTEFPRPQVFPDWLIHSAALLVVGLILQNLLLRQGTARLRQRTQGRAASATEVEATRP